MKAKTGERAVTRVLENLMVTTTTSSREKHMFSTGKAPMSTATGEATREVANLRKVGRTWG